MLAAIASGEIEVDVETWREAVGDFQSAFESLDSLRFIDVEWKKGK